MSVVAVKVTRHPRVTVRPRAANRTQCAAEPGARIEVVTGAPGPQGPPGVALAYRFVQASPSSLWTINHNLGRRPIVQLETVGGLVMLGDVVHLSDNIAQISFDVPTAGVASYI